jgi:hypothetical protein
LSQSFLRDGSPNAPVAVFKWMDALKVQVSNSSPHQYRQERFARWCDSVEPGNESLHFDGTRDDGGASK